MSTVKTIRWVQFAAGAAAALLILPALGSARTIAAFAQQADAAQSAQQDQDNQNNSQNTADGEERERQEAARERQQEAKDREQEARDRAQERVDRLEEIYDDGRSALDDEKYERARDKFTEVIEANGPQADAALYWKAYAQQHLGQRDAALTNIADLKKRFPQSRWQKDASALEIEIRQGTGHPSRPEVQGDEELKMLAIQSLMNSDPERAMPLLEKVLQGSATPKEKSRALFVLAQSGSPQSREIIARIAKGQSNPELQHKAIEYLGIFGGPEARKTMAYVYTQTNEVSVKRSILRSYMIGNDKEHLFEAAKNEKDPSLRGEAIRQLGIMHAESELEQLYKTETSPELKRQLLQAFFLAGDSTKLLAVARDEKNIDVRRSAVRNLGLIHSEESGKALSTMYGKESDRSLKEEILNALFLQNNAPAIVAIARAEKDPGLKKVAVQKLSMMNSKEGSDYMMEILQK